MTRPKSSRPASTSSPRKGGRGQPTGKSPPCRKAASLWRCRFPFSRRPAAASPTARGGTKRGKRADGQKVFSLSPRIFPRSVPSCGDRGDKKAKNGRRCPKRGPQNTVRVPDGPDRHAGGNSPYAPTPAPHGEGPRHRPYLPRPRLRGKRGETEGSSKGSGPPLANGKPLVGGGFPPSGKADNTACRQKGNRTVRPPCKRGAFSPLPGRGAPPPRARRAQKKAGGSRVAPLPPFARLCQGRPDRSPGRVRVTRS